MNLHLHKGPVMQFQTDSKNALNANNREKQGTNGLKYFFFRR